MSRAFSYIAMICGLISSVLFAVLAALFQEGNTHLYLCIAVTCMEFIFVRFNLVALRNDKTDRLFVVNNGRGVKRSPSTASIAITSPTWMP